MRQGEKNVKVVGYSSRKVAGKHDGRTEMWTVVCSTKQQKFSLCIVPRVQGKVCFMICFYVLELLRTKTKNKRTQL